MVKLNNFYIFISKISQNLWVFRIYWSFNFGLHLDKFLITDVRSFIKAAIYLNLFKYISFLFIFFESEYDPFVFHSAWFRTIHFFFNKFKALAQITVTHNTLFYAMYVSNIVIFTNFVLMTCILRLYLLLMSKIRFI